MMSCIASSTLFSLKRPFRSCCQYLLNLGVFIFVVVNTKLKSEVRTKWRVFCAKNITSVLVKIWLNCSPDECQTFLSLGMTNFCMDMLTKFVLMEYFRSRKRHTRASRLLRRSGPVKTMSLKGKPLLNFGFAFQIGKFLSLFGLFAPRSRTIHPVERTSLLEIMQM